VKTAGSGNRRKQRKQMGMHPLRIITQKHVQFHIEIGQFHERIEKLKHNLHNFHIWTQARMNQSLLIRLMANKKDHAGQA